MFDFVRRFAGEGVAVVESFLVKPPFHRFHRCEGVAVVESEEAGAVVEGAEPSFCFLFLAVAALVFLAAVIFGGALRFAAFEFAERDTAG